MGMHAGIHTGKTTKVGLNNLWFRKMLATTRVNGADGSNFNCKIYPTTSKHMRKPCTIVHNPTSNKFFPTTLNGIQRQVVIQTFGVTFLGHNVPEL